MKNVLKTILINAFFFKVKSHEEYFKTNMRHLFVYFYFFRLLGSPGMLPNVINYAV